MNVRPASAADANAMARLHAAAFDAAWSESVLLDMLADPAAFAFLAEGREPLGFILCRAAGGEAEVLTLAVAPAARRQGLGAALVEAAAQAGLTREAETLFLEVAVDNAPALALYRAAGFEDAGLRRGYYRRPNGPIDALVLRRGLNSRA